MTTPTPRRLVDSGVMPGENELSPLLRRRDEDPLDRLGVYIDPLAVQVRSPMVPTCCVSLEQQADWANEILKTYVGV